MISIWRTSYMYTIFLHIWYTQAYIYLYWWWTWGTTTENDWWRWSHNDDGHEVPPPKTVDEDEVKNDDGHDEVKIKWSCEEDDEDEVIMKMTKTESDMMTSKDDDENHNMITSNPLPVIIDYRFRVRRRSQYGDGNHNMMTINPWSVTTGSQIHTWVPRQNGMYMKFLDGTCGSKVLVARVTGGNPRKIYRYTQVTIDCSTPGWRYVAILHFKCNIALCLKIR